MTESFKTGEERQNMENKEIILFNTKQIRRHYDAKNEIWFFSIIDIIAALTESSNPRDYWFKMKQRVKTEDGFELSTICRQLKLKASDGKMHATDVADVQGIFRLILNQFLTKNIFMDKPKGKRIVRGENEIEIFKTPIFEDTAYMANSATKNAKKFMFLMKY